MRGHKNRIFAIGAAAILLAAIFMLGGCSVMQSRQGAPSPSQPAEDKPKTIYYDFSDILLPSELKVNKTDTFVFHIPGLTAGVLSLKGRLEANSLIAFFENKMPLDGWQAVGSFKGTRSMLLFRKPARWCAINVTKTQFNTQVEIWVAPTVVDDELGLNR